MPNSAARFSRGVGAEETQIKPSFCEVVPVKGWKETSGTIFVLSKTAMGETDASGFYEMGRRCLMSVAGHDNLLLVPNTSKLVLGDYAFPPKLT